MMRNILGSTLLSFIILSAFSSVAIADGGEEQSNGRWKSIWSDWFFGYSHRSESINSLKEKLAQLEIENSALRSSVSELQSFSEKMAGTLATLTSMNTDLAASVEALEGADSALPESTLLLLDNFQQFVSFKVNELGGPTIVFSGVNVHINNGMGSTESVNSLGNLILGYDETLEFSSQKKTGSHNLVIGPFNSYSRYGGAVIGKLNRIEGNFSVASGGKQNRAQGDFAVVSGGEANTASGYFSVVSGGFENSAAGDSTAISGGIDNRAEGLNSSVSGGFRNLATGNFSSVSGGFNRQAVGENDWVAGELLEDN